MTAEPRPRTPEPPPPPEPPKKPEDFLDLENHQWTYTRLALAGFRTVASKNIPEILDPTKPLTEDQIHRIRSDSWETNGYQRTYNPVVNGASRRERTDAWAEAANFEQAYSLWSAGLKSSMILTTDEDRKAAILQFTGKDSVTVGDDDIQQIYDTHCKGASDVDGFVRKAIAGNVSVEAAQWLAGRLFGKNSAQTVARIMEIEMAYNADTNKAPFDDLLFGSDKLDKVNHPVGEDIGLLDFLSKNYERPSSSGRPSQAPAPGTPSTSANQTTNAETARPTAPALREGLEFFNSDGKKVKVVSVESVTRYGSAVANDLGWAYDVILEVDGQRTSTTDPAFRRSFESGDFTLTQPPGYSDTTTSDNNSAGETESSSDPIIKAGMFIEDKSSGQRLSIIGVGDQGTIILWTGTRDVEIKKDLLLADLKRGEYALVDQDGKPAEQAAPSGEIHEARESATNEDVNLGSQKTRGERIKEIRDAIDSIYRGEYFRDPRTGMMFYPDSQKEQLDYLNDQLREIQAESIDESTPPAAEPPTLTPEALTPEALEFLEQYDRGMRLGLTNNLRRILRQNGITKEDLDRYGDSDPDILIQLLRQRRDSYQQYQDSLKASESAATEEANDETEDLPAPIEEESAQVQQPAPTPQPTPTPEPQSPTASPSTNTVDYNDYANIGWDNKPRNSRDRKPSSKGRNKPSGRRKLDYDN